MKVPQPSEAQTQKAILDYLAVKRIWHVRMNSGVMKTEKSFVRFGRPGMADILAMPKVKCTDGVHNVLMTFIVPVWIEVKGLKGKQSEAQVLFQKEVEAEGHLYVLARSLEDVLAVES